MLISNFGHLVHFATQNPEYFLPFFCFNLRYCNHPSSFLMMVLTGLTSDMLHHHEVATNTCYYIIIFLLLSKLPFEYHKLSFFSYLITLILLLIPFLIYHHFIGDANWTTSTFLYCVIITLFSAPFLYLFYSSYAKLFSYQRSIRKFNQLN